MTEIKRDLRPNRVMRCAIYTRVSTDLEQDFNSLDAQRESSEAYIKSQAHEGWRLVKERYDDSAAGGAPKGNRNALKHGGRSAETLALKREIQALARTAREMIAVIE